MHTFFHGWRRKAGVVTLGLACAVGTSWIRSFALNEVAWGFDSYIWIAHRGGLVLLDIEHYGAPGARWGWNSVPYERKESAPDWGWHHGQYRTIVSAPHYAIATPLTLLSAYLILWKPRKAKSSDQPANSN